jgi:hypothetical protein
MFTRHQRPMPETVRTRRERHHRQQALLRVRLREELLALLDSLRPERDCERSSMSRSLYL